LPQDKRFEYNPHHAETEPWHASFPAPQSSNVSVFISRINYGF
jgi:hypothetical protein